MPKSRENAEKDFLIVRPGVGEEAAAEDQTKSIVLEHIQSGSYLEDR